VTCCNGDKVRIRCGDIAYNAVTSPAHNRPVAFAGGAEHSLGLKSDGTIVAWGINWNGQCNVPEPNADFIAISSGGYHSLGLKSDGTIVAWGRNDVYGQCNVPAPNADFTAVAGGEYHSLGLKSTDVIAIENPGPGNEPGTEESWSGNVPGVAKLTIRSVIPNPFNPSTVISFEALVPGHMTLDIYDVGGRCIRTLALGGLGVGLHRAVWDGQDESGESVSSGVYFIRVRSDEMQSRPVKAVLIK